MRRYLQRVVDLLFKNERRRRVLVIALSFSFSIGGVILAAFWLKNENDGGRGGAIASVVSLSLMFMNSGYESDIYEFVTGRSDRKRKLDSLRNIKHAVDKEPLVKLQDEVDGLRAYIFTDLIGQQALNRSLAWAAGIGTLFWGFGDVAAKHLMPPAPLSSVSDTDFLRAKLSELESLDGDRWKNLSDQLEELRRGRDSIQHPLDEISHTLQSIGTSAQGVQKALDQAATLQSSSQEATKPEPSLPPHQPEPYSVSFDVGRVELNRAARQIVAQAAKNAVNAKTVSCNGYPDTSGNLSTNERLSIQRASSVAVELIRDGVSANRITIKIYDQQQAGRVVGIAIISQ
jgi:outer membrane protein OmpA-like peptidoglycan-associated protein